MQEMIKLKLSALFHKLLTGGPSRLIMMSDRFDTSIKVMRDCFDEFTEVKYDASDTSFWEKQQLMRYLNFMTVSSNTHFRNILMSNSCLFNNISDSFSPKGDIVFSCESKYDPELVSYVTDVIAGILDVEPTCCNIVTYNADIFSINDSLKPEFQKILKEVCDKYDGWVSPEISHIVMSVVSCILSKTMHSTISTVDTPAIWIDDNLIRSFYVIN